VPIPGGNVGYILPIIWLHPHMINWVRAHSLTAKGVGRKIFKAKIQDREIALINLPLLLSVAG